MPLSKTRPSLLAAALWISLGTAGCDKAKPVPNTEQKSNGSTSETAVASAAQTVTSENPCRAAAVQANPNVRWSGEPALQADLNYDGGPDLVVWGTDGDSLFVFSIVECAGQQPGKIWSFPLRARAAFGTVELGVSLVNPAFGEGYFRENCMGAETTSQCRQLATLNTRLEAAYQQGGRGLMVGVPDRHNVHLYWDSETNQFVMWRL